MDALLQIPRITHSNQIALLNRSTSQRIISYIRVGCELLLAHWKHQIIRVIRIYAQSRYPQCTSFFFQGDWVLTYLYRMHAIRLLCAGKLMLVSSCKTTQVVLDAPQVEKRIYVIDSAPHFPLLVLHRMHYLMHLPIPPVFRVIPV